LNTCSISALECSIRYITCLEQNQPVLCMGFLQWHLHTSFSPLRYCVSNISPTDNYKILPLVFSLPNDFTFYPKFIQKLNSSPMMFHNAFEIDINYISFIVIYWNELYFLKLHKVKLRHRLDFSRITHLTDKP